MGQGQDGHRGDGRRDAAGQGQQAGARAAAARRDPGGQQADQGDGAEQDDAGAGPDGGQAHDHQTHEQGAEPQRQALFAASAQDGGPENGGEGQAGQQQGRQMVAVGEEAGDRPRRGGGPRIEPLAAAGQLGRAQQDRDHGGGQVKGHHPRGLGLGRGQHGQEQGGGRQNCQNGLPRQVGGQGQRGPAGLETGQLQGENHLVPSGQAGPDRGRKRNQLDQGDGGQAAQQSQGEPMLAP